MSFLRNQKYLSFIYYDFTFLLELEFEICDPKVVHFALLWTAYCQIELQ